MAVSAAVPAVAVVRASSDSASWAAEHRTMGGLWNLLPPKSSKSSRRRPRQPPPSRHRPRHPTPHRHPTPPPPTPRHRPK